MDNKTVVVGMSGGVDSSVAALLLKKQGYNVIGATMQIWLSEALYDMARQDGCCSLTAVDDAKKVCGIIGIEHRVLNFRDIFRKKVIENFVQEYINGRTPNPCIVCNRYVKWEALLSWALENGADYIATGHYARVKKLENGRFAIAGSATAAKDQTYALYSLTQDQLSHTLMPIGDYDKETVRKIAGDAGLPVSGKPDSQEICFIEDNDYAGFIERYPGIKVPGPGNFVTADGRVLGKHKGITHYTIGQRRGLGLPMGRYVYVTDIRPDTDEVVIGEGEDVFSKKLCCRDLNFMSVEDIPEGEEKRLFCKIRYRHAGQYCRVSRTGSDELTAVFEEPARAVTPGQAAVFYDGDVICAGGTIV
ncbi:MAG: tRNA 2-thiouridine(34) synthase MnmA [Lachnospiraceae bacterium]|nr:tRNA 2-thiouridine(34) synthase MnmA [Lachnospiraceae bacterium]